MVHDVLSNAALRTSTARVRLRIGGLRLAVNTPLANVVTLGVRDFAAERDFYRRLRWPQALDLEEFAAFELRGIVLALFRVEQLAVDARAEPQPTRDGIGFSIIINVENPEDVDEMVARFREAGGRVTRSRPMRNSSTGVPRTSPILKATSGRLPG